MGSLGLAAESMDARASRSASGFSSRSAARARNASFAMAFAPWILSALMASAVTGTCLIPTRPSRRGPTNP